MEKLTEAAAKKLSKAIRKMEAPYDAELKKINDAQRKAIKELEDKWRPIKAEVVVKRTELVEQCPHKFCYEMSYASCEICGYSYNRSH